MASESPRARPPHSCICLHLLLLTALNSLIEFHSPVQHTGTDSYFTHKYYSPPTPLPPTHHQQPHTHPHTPAVLFCRTVFNLNLFSLHLPTRTNIGIITSEHVLLSVILSPPGFPRQAGRASSGGALINTLLWEPLCNWELHAVGGLAAVLMSQCWSAALASAVHRRTL